eukprot:TRINITY_DN9761_c0_g1_i1.p2 TRINITY_DN9761_c0_g1~~TRINITY_DN9761_c0_g1_i1.p2  ORF type:complete len:118 (-),score=23.58 TRINITY_DN9761_c0_g1_i1:118-471(-)
MEMPQNLHCPNANIPGSFAGLPASADPARWHDYTITACNKLNHVGIWNIFELPTCEDYQNQKAIEQWHDEFCSTTIWRGTVVVGAFFPADKSDFQWLETTVVYRYPFKILLVCLKCE